jgi:hypothetical protein
MIMEQRDSLSGPSANASLEELKHSIRLHLLLQAGPTPQLCVFLVKVFDFIDDLYKVLALADGHREELLEKIAKEMDVVSFSIVETIALFVQRSIDDRMTKAASQGQTAPESVRRHGDEIFMTLGKCRGLPDKIAAKNMLLKGVAEALRALATFTKASYPEIRDSKDTVL